MASVVVRQRDVAGIVDDPDFDQLIEEYAKESAILGMPAPAAKFDAYRKYEALGFLHAYGAYVHDDMVGFITVIAPILPHYAMPVAVVESFFVASAHRKTGAGLKLLETAETRARDLHSPGLLVSTPFQGRLFEVLPRRGYQETNRVFFKRLADA